MSLEDRLGYQEIVYSKDNHVATITLNRPEAMNALTMQTYAELENALKEASVDKGVRALIITGAGRGFCSGDDVKQVMLDPGKIEERAREWGSRIKPTGTPAAAALLSFGKPLIAAVNGSAVGWGMDLALMCDIRIASERARFGEIFVRRGLIPDLGGFYCLPLIVGLSNAYKLLYTGDVIDAQEALRIGLVSEVVPHDDLEIVTKELAIKIAKNPPLAVQMVKEAVRKGLNYNLASLGEYHGYALSVLFQTEDHKEGATAFVEKREPLFQGR